MGFPPKIKTEALVAAARHCCLCHRYKGLKVEIHHITQEADGGANTLENAIALCFDCHADAGHYNIHHPKGTKISPDELRLSRDSWHKIVKEHKITEPIDGTDELHIRYLVCRDSEISRKIIGGDMSDIPAPAPLLVHNEVLQSFRSLFVLQDSFYKTVESWGESFTSANEYLKRYPYAEPTDPSDFSNPYYRTTRVPQVSEISALLGKGSLISHLLDSGLKIHDFLTALGYPDLCGTKLENDVYVEYLSCRQLWPVFLHITNVSETQLQFSNLEGHTGDSDVSKYFNAINHNIRSRTFSLPPVSLQPNQSILVPVMMTMPPMANLDEETLGISFDNKSEFVIHFNRSDLHSGQPQFISTGPYILPQGLFYQRGSNKKYASIHSIDLTRTYTLDRHWQIGSCPHLFFEDVRGLRYVRELFSQFPNEVYTEVFVIPKGVRKVIIAEIEDEQTVIEEIRINDITVETKHILYSGDTLTLNVYDLDRITITGKYVTLRTQQNSHHIQYRNILIGRFMREMLYKKKSIILD